MRPAQQVGFIPQLNCNDVADRVILAIRTDERLAVMPGFFRILMPFKWIVPWLCISEFLRGLVPDAVPIAPPSAPAQPESTTPLLSKNVTSPLPLAPPARHERRV
ncbi:hypothetical protein EVAR_19155_1 [Eumeta japonica]|uniref:Uncharacterized protein n=1 Tax=Eumeta variegata TaxID=151549 RepID=A0A4C1VNT6_EUMVA|nr:hypothetical protein EVAR_19155_1 [Eumeta japonica]